jgi:hypothetical protein
MAAADHPVLKALCDQVAKQASFEFHDKHSMLDTLDRTGPGPFSDAVFSHNASAEMQVSFLGDATSSLGDAKSSG